MQSTTETTQLSQGAPLGGGAAPRESSLLRSVKLSALPMLSRLATAEHAFSNDTAASGLPPGYSGFFSSLYCYSKALLGNILDLLIELNDRFGGGEEMSPVRFHFLGKPSVLVTNPRHIQQIFKDQEHFSQSSDPSIRKRFGEFLGFNLVSVDYDVWRAVRPRTAAFLAGRPLAEYGEVMRRVWPSGPSCACAPLSWTTA